MTDTQRTTPDYLALAESLGRFSIENIPVYPNAALAWITEAAAALREAAGEIGRLTQDKLILDDARLHERTKRRAAEKELEQVRAACAEKDLPYPEASDDLDRARRIGFRDAQDSIAAILDQQETDE